MSGFFANDKIDLANLTFSGTATDVWDQSAGTLTISNDGVTDVMHLAGTYTQSDFALIGDATGGTSGGIDVVFSSADTIADGATYTVSAPSGDTIAFATGNGTLDLAQPATFTGEIAGISGSGDVLDIHGFIATSTTAVSGSFNSATDTTTLTVTDTSDNLTETFTLAGDYSASAWTVTDDGNGGVNIVDPPAAASLAIAIGASLEISNPVATAQGVKFDGSTGHLTLDAPSSFTGLISGFTGDGTLTGSDQIDLKGINYDSSSFSELYNPTTDTLTVSDGTTTAVLHFIGTYVAANFSFVSDGHGGTIVYDPPVTGTPAPNAAGSQTPVPNQTPAGGDGSSHGFIFNFTSGGSHSTTDSSGGGLLWTSPAGSNNDFHSTIGQPDGSLPGSLPAGSHAAPDFHSTPDQSGIVPVDHMALSILQAHANGFHIV